MRDSVLIYRSFWEALKQLPAEDRLSAITAIIDYGLDGIEPDVSGVASAMFLIAKPQIDRILHFMDKQNGRRCKEYQEWRNEVFERDNYTCQICGKRGVTLNAHHIMGYSMYPCLRYDLENGITLCKDCHREVHRNERKEG